MSHQAYPLAWPEGWPRTRPEHRERWAASNITVAGALKELQDELRRLGVQSVVLSSNVTLGAERPEDPGVVAYGVYQKLPIAIPCDRWNTVAGNLRAIAKTIEAMRGMERWGAKHMIRAMFQGFTALPAATAGQRHWREVLGVAPDNNPTRDVLEKMRNHMAKRYHPDMPGGSTEAMAAINVAFDQAVKELGL